MLDNTTLLSHSHNIVKAKRRAKKGQIDNVLFDEDARREYLTGFRKRNLLKKEAAKTRAKERQRQDRLQSRRDQREALQQQAAQNASFVEKAYRDKIDGPDPNSSDEDDEFHGFSSSADNLKGKERASEHAYEGEQQFATVTVVQEFDPHHLLHPIDDVQNSPANGRFRSLPLTLDSELDASRIKHSSNQNHNHNNPDPELPSNPQNRSLITTHSSDKVKAKKKIAYETKAARKAARVKQRSRRSEKAELAGGKHRRKDKGKGKRAKH